MKRAYNCAVCGEHAPITRVSRDGELLLCYAHENVHTSAEAQQLSKNTSR